MTEDERDTSCTDELISDIDLPPDSIFRIEEYAEMQKCVSSEISWNILQMLREEPQDAGSLSKELGADFEPLDSHLRRLRRFGLVKAQNGPQTEVKEKYVLTSLGRKILAEGAGRGVRKLAAEELILAKTYGRRNDSG